MYIKEVRLSDSLSANQNVLVIIDVFTGQMRIDVLNLLPDNKILLTNVPTNMTKFYQPLHLTDNGYGKRFMARKFNDCFMQYISVQLDKGIVIDKIDAKLRLSLLKPLHAECLVGFYNHITSGAAKKIIDNRWNSSVTEDAINMCLDSLPLINPFNDIAPMMVELNESSPPFHNHAICNLLPELKLIGYSREDISDEEEEAWCPVDDRIIFDVIDKVDDENKDL